jgi:hypothetical protein
MGFNDSEAIAEPWSMGVVFSSTMGAKLHTVAICKIYNVFSGVCYSAQH